MNDRFQSFEIAMLIKEINSSMTRIIGAEFQERGLTHQQIMIIKLIAHNKEINISELCNEMSLTKGTVSGIVKRMEIAGYVEKKKHMEDKRNTYLVFSEKGLLFAKEFRETINDSFQNIFKNFSPEEMEKTKEDLIELRNKIKEENKI
ncbi:MAG: MarR family transcriptional regulator [Eubacteriales bacterium]